jgi:hypothetical protein
MILLRKYFVIITCLLFVFGAACSRSKSEPTPFSISQSLNTMTLQGDTNMNLSTQNIITEQELNTTNPPNYAENDQSKKTADILGINSKESYDELIKNDYPAEMIKDIVFAETNNFNTTMDWLNEKYPIECVRTPKNAMAYIIYRLKTGEQVVVFFHGDTLKFASWCFVIDKALSKSAFASIKEGDSLDKVETLDAGFKLYNEVKTGNLHWKNVGASLHIVSDGFIKIEYQGISNGDFDRATIKVKSIAFYPNGSEILGQTYCFMNTGYLLD